MPARHFVIAATAALILGAGVFPGSRAIVQDAHPSSVLPSGGGQALLDPSDTVLLLLDHQTGLFQTVKDIGITELRTNTAMLAKLATMFNIPVITTASEPNGPNGPLMPEIAGGPECDLRAPQGRSECLGQPGFRQHRAQDRPEDPDHRGRLDQRLRHVPGARRQGGGLQGLRGHGRLGRSEQLASRTTLARFAQAGVIPTTANAVLSEVHRTWNRPDAAEVRQSSMAWWRRTTPPSRRAIGRAQEAAAQKK